MKAFYELISQITDSSDVFLLRKKGEKVENLFAKEIKLSAEDFEKLYASAREKTDVVAESAETVFQAYAAGSKKKYVAKFSLPDEKFLLIIFSDKKNGYGAKTRGKIDLTLEIIRDFLTRESSEKKAEIPSNFFIPFFVYDKKKDEIVFATEGFEKLLGFKPADWRKKRFSVFRHFDPLYFNALRKFFSDVAAGKEAYFDFEFTDNFSNERFLRCYAAPSEEKSEFVAGIILDITNEKHLRDRLEAANAKFKTLLNISNDLIFSLNRSGYFMLVNDEGAINLGYYANELIGKHFLEIVAEEDKPTVALAFQKILKTNEAVTFDVKFTDKLEKEIPFKITAISLKSENEITGMIGYGKNFQSVFNEKMKLKELNEKLLESNRLLALERDRAAAQVSALEKLNELKNEFLSNISHELRTPLASIIGFSEAIAEDESLSHDLIREFNEIILAEGKRLIKLIDDILDYSKLEDGEFELKYEKFDIIELLKILIDNYKVQAEVKKIELLAEFPEAEFSVEADREQLEKAIGNIISNAIKFTNEEGKVEISVRNFLNEISITITDNGIGIPEEELKELFQKFKKAKSSFKKHIPGAGLGLAISKKIIDNHGGSINISSVENQGTTVAITLPKKRSA